MENFIEFLKDIFVKLHPEVLDDDISSKFEKWLEQLDKAEYLGWGELYGKGQYLKGKQETIEKMLKTIKG